MTRQKIDMSPERSIVTSLITSTDFCKQIIPILEPKYFVTRYAKVVGQWIMDHYTIYNEAPNTLIKDIFQEKKGSLDEEEAESIAEFLGSLSEEFTQKSTNFEYELNKADRYIRTRALEFLKDQLEVAIHELDPEKGESSIANFKRVGRPENQAISILSDTTEIQDAFEETQEILFKFPKATGQVIPDPMRGDLLAFLGAQKAGKTWALQFTAEQALANRLKVVWFSLEMRKPQMLRRLWQSMVSSPRFESKVTIPYFKPCFDPSMEIQEEDKKWELYQREEIRAGVDISSIEKQQQRAKMLYRGGDIRCISIPSRTATFEDIVSQLDNLAYYEGFRPDVVVIDYADILLPSKGSGSEKRHQLNDIWLKCRGLAMQRNILVVTATQSNRGGINGETGAENIAEDIQKLGHVSAMVAINRKKEDKKRGIVRLNCIAQRDGEEALQEAIATQCLAMGRFHLDSKLASQVDYGEE